VRFLFLSFPFPPPLPQTWRSRARRPTSSSVRVLAWITRRRLATVFYPRPPVAVSGRTRRRWTLDGHTLIQRMSHAAVWSAPGGTTMILLSFPRFFLFKPRLGNLYLPTLFNLAPAISLDLFLYDALFALFLLIHPSSLQPIHSASLNSCTSASHTHTLPGRKEDPPDHRFLCLPFPSLPSPCRAVRSCFVSKSCELLTQCAGKRTAEVAPSAHLPPATQTLDVCTL